MGFLVSSVAKIIKHNNTTYLVDRSESPPLLIIQDLHSKSRSSRSSDKIIFLLYLSFIILLFGDDYLCVSHKSFITLCDIIGNSLKTWEFSLVYRVIVSYNKKHMCGFFLKLCLDFGSFPGDLPGVYLSITGQITTF